MKCIGSFIILALLSFTTILSGPTTIKHVFDRLFEYIFRNDGIRITYLCYIAGLKLKAIIF